MCSPAITSRPAPIWVCRWSRVGLLYAEGYFHQELDGDGWQRERNERIDPEALGIHPTGIEVHVDLAGVDVTVRVWRVDVGRIPLYLLDTNVPTNPPEAIAVTDRLYGGDEQHRLRQEIILGIGGVRALRALGIHPQVFHTNEGHAGFLGLERIREWIDRGLSFDEAIEAVRAGSVFTTHTPVPAGIDQFPLELFERYFASFAEQCGITFAELVELGQGASDDAKFNMALMGLRLAARANGVARLHGEVSPSDVRWALARPSRQGDPDRPRDQRRPRPVVGQRPCRRAAGASHRRRMAPGRRERLGPGEAPRSSRDLGWSAIRVAAELVDMVRRLTGEDVLDPGVLTIGFARRFATYKRSTLLLGQMDRLKALLLDADRPVQFVFAGKAHPADEPGKAMIREIDRLARAADVGHRFVFIADYDIGIARTMYHGCDVWLNTPRRPMEACGTSGMKAALNGVLNCSIRDGWWDEMSADRNGFDIASFDHDGDYERRDRREASDAFDVIENHIVPSFYGRGDDGLPHDWIDRITTNWMTLGWNVIATRMVRDYVTEYYEPAAISSDAISADGAGPARELAAWKQRVAEAWPGVRVTIDVGESNLDPGAATDERRVVAHVDPGMLTEGELDVQAVHGPVTADGQFDEPRLTVIDMTAIGRGSIRRELRAR